MRFLLGLLASVGHWLPIVLTSTMVAMVFAQGNLLILGQGAAEEGSWESLPSLLLAWLLLVGVLGNMGLFMWRDPSIKRVFLPSHQGQGWRYCYHCESYVPPRSHHCFECHVCVLRRDHHCVFFGRCVGFANLPAFVACLLHLWLGLLYSLVLNAHTLVALVQQGFSVRLLLSLFMPWLMWILGQMDSWDFLSTFVADMSFVGFLFVSGMLAFHMWIVAHGQTSAEWTHGFKRYDLGLQRNLQQTLGDRWYLLWLSPFLPARLPPGDGIHFTEGHSAAPQTASAPAAPSRRGARTVKNL
ncbi:putative palmitoyltransferase ZDHHC24 isoform X2 [Petromyzon marinus]